MSGGRGTTSGGGWRGQNRDYCDGVPGVGTAFDLCREFGAAVSALSNDDGGAHVQNVGLCQSES